MNRIVVQLWTDEGRKIAGTIKRRHKLLEVFLTEVLRINREKGS